MTSEQQMPPAGGGQPPLGPPQGPPQGPPPGPPQGAYPPGSAPQYGAPQYGYPAVDPAAPFGRNPLTGEPLSDKSKLAAGLLELFLGWTGAGRWYLGDTGIAIAQLLTCGGLGIWALIDAIMMLTGNVRDKYGRPLRD
jgi:hypothetical protein